MNNLSRILVLILGFYFIFFTFFDLNWGAPYYFHPDERNVASAVSQLNFESNMNPNFFAYGQLPIYIIYFVGILFNLPNNGFAINPILPFEQAIIISRLLSAGLSIALIFLIYKITLLLKNKDAATLAFILSSTSVAFLQFNHFGTFEIWLSFLYLAATYQLLKFLKSKNLSNFISASILFGISLGLKLSSIVYLIVPVSIVVIRTLELKLVKERLKTIIKLSVSLILFVSSFYFLSSPFNIIDWNSFSGSMDYESSVARGTLPVFYTGFFYNQIPIVYQFLKILPFLINPILTIIFPFTFVYLVINTIKKKDRNMAIVLLTFLTLFVSGSVLFVKWTRYIIPAIPFLYIIISIAIVDVLKNQKLLKLAFIYFALIGIFFSLSFIKTVRIDGESQILALKFAEKNIPSNARILSEVYDLGIVPFNPKYHNISLFNFYDLDNNPNQNIILADTLKRSDYIILPSQRIYQGRSDNPVNFPAGNKFYSDLFSGKLGFNQIYQTPCDVFCKITYLKDPVFGVEQTVNVFDRPNVFIFKRK